MADGSESDYFFSKLKQTTASSPKEWTNSQRTFILVISFFVALLGPISNTMYMPALPIVAEDLNTTEAMVDLTIALTFVLLGFFPMVWGSISDEYGRRKPMLLGIFVHIVTSLACAFAWNIESLIFFRILQAIGVSSLLVIGAGSISDIYPPSERGNALGWFTMAPSIGPLVGPPIGGALAQEFGWRSIFYANVAAASTLFVLSFFLFPETLAKLSHPQPEQKPVSFLSLLQLTFAPFKFLSKPHIIFAVLTNGFCQSTTVGVLVFFPHILDKTFHLDPFHSGISYLPYGLMALLGAKIGGMTCDWFASQFGVGARLFPSVYATILYSLGVVLWIFATEYPVILIATGILGFGFCGLRPGFPFTSIFNSAGIYSFLMEQFPGQSSGIAAVILCVQFTMACIATIVGPRIWNDNLGKDLFFGIQAACTFLTAIPILFIGISHMQTKREGYEEVLSDLSKP